SDDVILVKGKGDVRVCDWFALLEKMKRVMMLDSVSQLDMASSRWPDMEENDEGERKEEVRLQSRRWFTVVPRAALWSRGRMMVRRHR
ncbi:hypothetical protein HAX54_017316, partial [Datura stramonium]|nr:hypothetical protein [Datura stramonium]